LGRHWALDVPLDRERDTILRHGVDIKTWQVGRLSEIGSDRSPEWWRDWARDPEYGRSWRQIRQHFGITGFGVNANEAAAGEEHVVPHEELSYGGQEELYFIVRGRARFTCDGEEVELREGGLLYVPPAVVREAVASETPTVVFMVGGKPNSYEPFDWAAWKGAANTP
jgi:mannose-6-phosphate isomerase-like protein (cupin superfamily)